MHQLRYQVQQQQLNLTKGFLKFYQSTIHEEDVRVLMDQVMIFERKRIEQQEENNGSSIIIPLKHIAFEFCRFSDCSHNLLRTFFHSLPWLESITWIKNSIANINMANIFDGVPIKNMNIIFSSGQLAYLHRQDVIVSLYNSHVETFNFEYKGTRDFDLLTDEAAMAIPKLKHLQSLRLDGWFIRNETFTKMISSLSNLKNLKSLYLGRLRGLTYHSLEAITTLGKGNNNTIDNTNNNKNKNKNKNTTDHQLYSKQERLSVKGLQEQPIRLDELELIMIPSLFLQQVENGGKRAACDAIESFLTNLSIRKLTIQESRLDRSVVRAIFRGLVFPSSSSSSSSPSPSSSYSLCHERDRQFLFQVLRLKAWSFGQEEWDQLMIVLPNMKLSHFYLSQGGIDCTTTNHKKAIVHALQKNMTMTKCDISFRGNSCNGQSYLPLGEILERNQNIQLLKKALNHEGRTDLVTLVLTRIINDQSSPMVQASGFYMLLHHQWGC